LSCCTASEQTAFVPCAPSSGRKLLLSSIAAALRIKIEKNYRRFLLLQLNLVQICYAHTVKATRRSISQFTVDCTHKCTRLQVIAITPKFLHIISSGYCYYFFMTTSMKFDLPLLNYDTRFSLWQVKMRGILAQTHDYDEALAKEGDSPVHSFPWFDPSQ
jgi:hypothetical protein